MAGTPEATVAAREHVANDSDRSPVDVAISPDGRWIISANHGSGTVSLVDTATEKRVDEIAVGKQPTAVVFSPNGKLALVTALQEGTVTLLAIDNGKLKKAGTIHLGYEPYGIAISPEGNTAYVAQSAAHQIAVIDLPMQRVGKTIAVGRWPRHVALSPDGKKLVVANSGDATLSVIDTATHQVLFETPFKGLNPGHLQVAADNAHVYFPWVFYGDNPPTPGNIRIGWVTGSRVAKVGLSEANERTGISLDPAGRAVGDPHGLAIGGNERQMVVTAGGTHELLVFRFGDVPFGPIGGGEHIDPKLLADRERFDRVPLGGRPLGVRISPDGKQAYVANYLLNAVQVVDLQSRQLKHTIALGGTDEKQWSLARRGEAIFYDAGRSLDGWYSCHTCHWEGGSNREIIDTFNDGTSFTYKTVLPLWQLPDTGPFTWHGWQRDVGAAMRESMTSTMRGPVPSDDDVAALVEYFRTLRPPVSPFRNADGTLTAAAARGQKLFVSEAFGCATCHSGPNFTDGEIHDVGLGSPGDKYRGFNTPSLLGVYRKTRLLHHGRAHSLAQLLQEFHNPAKLHGGPALSEAQIADLVAYLQAL